MTDLFSLSACYKGLGLAPLRWISQMLCLHLCQIVNSPLRTSSYSLRSYTSTHNERRRNARSSDDEEANPKHQTKVRSRWCALIVLHQSDKWHNETTPLNVRAVSVSLPVGLCRMANGGNT